MKRISFLLTYSSYKSSLIFFLFFFIAFFSTSPLWFNLGGTAIVTYLVIMPIFLVVGWNQRMPLTQISLILLILVMALLPSLFWMDYRFVLYPLFLIFALFLVSSTTIYNLKKFVELSSWFFLIILFGCWIGLFLYLNGVPPIWEISNPDGRTNYFFITTFSNLFFDGFMRPSGIYDEPGTLAFFLSFIIYARLVLKLNVKLTYLLLILGFITFSYAFFIFSFMTFFIFINKKNIFLILCLSGLVTYAALNLGFLELFNDYLFLRVSNGLQEDGRFTLLINALNILKKYPYSFFFGLNPDCIFRIEVCKSIAGYFSENPLSPLVSMGIFLSWPYYVYLIIVFINLFKFSREGFLLFSFGLQFLQRPNVMSHGYSLLAVLSVWLFLKRKELL